MKKISYRKELSEVYFRKLLSEVLLQERKLGRNLFHAILQLLEIDVWGKGVIILSKSLNEIVFMK